MAVRWLVELCPWEYDCLLTFFGGPMESVIFDCLALFFRPTPGRGIDGSMGSIQLSSSISSRSTDACERPGTAASTLGRAFSTRRSSGSSAESESLDITNAVEGFKAVDEGIPVLGSLTR